MLEPPFHLRTIIGKCLFYVDNSPCKNSLLISSVTKKKIAINASFIQCKTESLRPKLFIPINKYLSNVEKYRLDNSNYL